MQLLNEPLATIKRQKGSKMLLYWKETRKEKDERIEIEKESQKNKKESGSKIAGSLQNILYRVGVLKDPLDSEANIVRK